MSWPIIDHSVFSPSGKVSKRAERAAKERLRKELFPEGLAEPKGPQTSERDRDMRKAANFRELAERGMCPRKYRKEAEKLEEKWKNS